MGAWKKKNPTSHESDDLFVQGERVSTVASIQREGFFLLESEENWKWNSDKCRIKQEHQRNRVFFCLYLGPEF